jgi:CDGSH-type Zn-finger protein
MPTPRIVQKEPYVMEMEAGTYIWCSCGLSKNDPFCDNSHKGTEFEKSGKAALLVKIENDGEQHWCGCKQTGSPPFCDGSHEKL